MIPRLSPLALSAPVRFVRATLLVTWSVAGVALAQEVPSPAPPQGLHAVSALTQKPAQLRGTALDGGTVDLQALRGKVVLVVYWSTDCAVCRDLMPELRSNVAGWKDQPFALVGVSFDARREDALTYARLMATLVPASMRFPTVWKSDPGFLNTLGTPDMLPGAWLLDKQGHVVERFQGRIPAEAWNRIADLL
jgi:thiol-disulfide isomerase/thioredoxin